ncbi:MAG: AI-2E family transporter [Pirellulaceae bacterium]|nr:AI-2E family transporter [Pirellulaceae bacterium]
MMQTNSWTTAGVRNVTIIVLTLAVSLLFVGVIWDFLMALFLAAVFAALVHPLYRLVLRNVNQRQALASGITVGLVVLVVVLPLVGLLAVVIGEAYQVSEQLVPWLKEQLRDPAALQLKLPAWIPYRDQLDLSETQLGDKLSEVAGTAGSFLLRTLSRFTQGTASFGLELFVMLYAMFFFLQQGTAIRDRLLYLLPLPKETKDRLVEKGLSVTRATIKGTMVIGAIQGALAGAAYVVAGVPGAVLWGVITAVASVIPAVGTTLIWLPVVIYLLATGHTAAAIGVAVWCAGLVGTIDNVLRPRLVGNDTKMPDLLILISTLGGLSLFGALGLLVGPIVAALCVTMWDVCSVTFRGVLDDEPPTAAPVIAAPPTSE